LPKLSDPLNAPSEARPEKSPPPVMFKSVIAGTGAGVGVGVGLLLLCEASPKINQALPILSISDLSRFPTPVIPQTASRISSRAPVGLAARRVENRGHWWGASRAHG
jgi:hypothetical protein